MEATVSVERGLVISSYSYSGYKIACLNFKLLVMHMPKNMGLSRVRNAVHARRRWSTMHTSSAQSLGANR